MDLVKLHRLFFQGQQKAMDIETGKRIATILKQYPEQYAKLKYVVQEMIKTLSQLIEE